MLKSFLLFTVLFVLAAPLVSGKELPITLDIVNTVLGPDGFNRSVITANGTYPGPLIRAEKGDHLKVTVNNRLTDPTMRRSTSINFDGIYVNTSNNFNEGSSFVDTCPFGPNTTYVYDVPLIDDQTGTHWYHSMLSVQYVDGLRGPLIIYDPDDPQKDLYDIDDESTIIQIGDWWHNTSVELLANYTSGQGQGVVPVPDCGTMNGRGRFVGGPEVPFSVTTVTPGKRHRLRIINESARDVFTVSIDNHSVTVIEADGVAHEPYTVDQLDIHAGQRYSLILNANQPVGNYWIRAPLAGGDLFENPNQDPSLSKGILRYAGAPEEDPTSDEQTNPNIFNEANLVPLFGAGDLGQGPADINLTLTLVPILGFAIWTVNNVSYVAPEVPTLVKILSDNATTEADFNVTENTFILPRNKIIDITFPPNDDDDAHPIHLHGHNFEVIKSSTGNTTNLVNPPRRDVTAAASTGMSLRFRTDTPGPWFFHCHIFWHMQAGLATVMLTDPQATRDAVHPTPEWEALCPAYAALPAELQ
ncbi:multicopper oxidase [Ramaria rubella]|nr:multicopper oxidase [Ramaria rubella]